MIITFSGNRNPLEDDNNQNASPQIIGDTFWNTINRSTDDLKMVYSNNFNIQLTTTAAFRAGRTVTRTILNSNNTLGRTASTNAISYNEVAYARITGATWDVNGFNAFNNTGPAPNPDRQIRQFINATTAYASVVEPPAGSFYHTGGFRLFSESLANTAGSGGISNLNFEYNNFNRNWPNDQSQTFQVDLRIETIAVPEPSSALFLGFAGFGLLALRRRSS